jgi:ubiquinone/menaquinone biosynthesis C-methylase UbiE
MTYVHGYTTRETQRLLEQSLILEELLHTGTRFQSSEKVLEAGCGVGAQTRILARRNPEAIFECIDISPESLEQARGVARQEGIHNATFKETDILSLPYKPGSFDHVFVCFVLEHLPDPVSVLRTFREILKPGGSITLIEGDHGSGFWTPDTDESKMAWKGLVDSQIALGHDPNIGRRVYPLLDEAGFQIKDVSPRWVYADQSNPTLLHGVIDQIIAPMVYSAEKQVLDSAYLQADEWEKGLADIREVARHPKGTFFYTWFKGVGIKPTMR